MKAYVIKKLLSLPLILLGGIADCLSGDQNAPR